MDLFPLIVVLVCFAVNSNAQTRILNKFYGQQLEGFCRFKDGQLHKNGVIINGMSNS